MKKTIIKALIINLFIICLVPLIVLVSNYLNIFDFNIFFPTVSFPRRDNLVSKDAGPKVQVNLNSNNLEESGASISLSNLFSKTIPLFVDLTFKTKIVNIIKPLDNSSSPHLEITIKIDQKTRTFSFDEEDLKSTRILRKESSGNVPIALNQLHEGDLILFTITLNTASNKRVFTKIVKLNSGG